MPIREVRSPISSSSNPRGFGPGSNQPLSPGARSLPGRRADQTHEQQLPQAHISLGGGDEPAELPVIGPEGRQPLRRDIEEPQDRHGEKPQEHQPED
jgi:hypothetical protein